MQTATRISKKILVLLTAALLAVGATSFAGDGPEPGPPDADVQYRYVAPPLTASSMSLILKDEGGIPETPELYVTGTAVQAGNPDCYIHFSDHMLVDDARIAQDFDGISCSELSPRDFIGNAQEPNDDTMTVSDDCELVEGYEIIAAGNIQCVEDETGAANSGTARIILMGYKPASDF